MRGARTARAASALLAAFAALCLPRGVLAEDAPKPEIPVLERLDLRDLPLSDACRLIAEQTGLNVVASADAGRERVSIFLRDVAAMDALDALCKAHQLWYQRDPKSGIVRISTAKEYRRDLGTIEEEQIEYFTLLHPNAMEVGEAIANLFGSRVVLRVDSAGQEETDELQDRLDRFDVIDERTQGLGVRLSNSQENGGSVEFDAQDSRRSSRRLTDQTTSQTDATPVQPLPRSRAPADLTAEEIIQLEVALAAGGAGDERRAALLSALGGGGRSPIWVTVARRQNKVIVRTADVRAMAQVRTMVQRLDIPTPLILLEVRILAVDLTDGMSSFFEYAFKAGDTAGAFTNGSIRQGPAGTLDLGGTGLRSGDLTFVYVSEHFAARMQVLEEHNRVHVLSSPMLLTANNEVSRLFVGKEVPLNRSFSGGSAVTNDNTVTTTPGSTDIEFQPVGMTLFITPNINSDRTVTLRIVQEASDVNSTAQVLVPSERGFKEERVSVVSSQTVSGTIVAKSDLAVAFGGLVEKGTVKEDDKVPFLGDIPLLGILFSRKVDRETRREIVIMVRPHVINTPAESEEISRRVLEGVGVDFKQLVEDVPRKDAEKK